MAVRRLVCFSIFPGQQHSGEQGSKRGPWNLFTVGPHFQYGSAFLSWRTREPVPFTMALSFSAFWIIYFSLDSLFLTILGVGLFGGIHSVNNPFSPRRSFRGASISKSKRENKKGM